MNLLLIEDDRETADHICHALRESGHTVDECGNGWEGLAQARNGDYAARTGSAWCGNCVPKPARFPSCSSPP